MTQKIKSFFSHLLDTMIEAQKARAEFHVRQYKKGNYYL